MQILFVVSYRKATLVPERLSECNFYLAGENIPWDKFQDISGVFEPIFRMNPHDKHLEVPGAGSSQGFEGVGHTFIDPPSRRIRVVLLGELVVVAAILILKIS